MPIKIGWLVENRISYYGYYGDVSVEELQQGQPIGQKMLSECEAPLLHTIQDNTHMTSFPSNAAFLVKITRALLSHPRMGWMVTVGIENQFIQKLAAFVAQISRTRYRTFNTLDEAIAFLAYVDETLPDMTGIEAPTDDEMLYHLGFATEVMSL